MSTPSLGWQSWSPPYPNIFHIPRRDYPPSNLIPPTLTPNMVKQNSHLKFSYWCSWYAYGWQITPERILREARAIKKYQLPIDCILIDDGWDPNWIVPLSQKLHALGFKVGLWYAPFTRHKHLPLYPTLNKLIQDCQLDVLKLDFLYQPYFDQSVLDPSSTLRDLFTYLHHNFPKLITVGCGVPFSDAIGRVSTIRFSKDTAFPPYLPKLIGRLIYLHRIQMLYQKYLAWGISKPFVPDPDVRMFSLESPSTIGLWSKMTYSVNGIGDKISSLSPDQINEVKIWLQK